jgi:hypothetical protein
MVVAFLSHFLLLSQFNRHLNDGIVVTSLASGSAERFTHDFGVNGRNLPLLFNGKGSISMPP